MRASWMLLLFAVGCGSNPATETRHPPTPTASPQRARVERWFAGREAGRPELPARLFVDCQPATRDQFMEFLDHDPGHGATVFHLAPHTPIERMRHDQSCAAMPAGTEIVLVSTGAPSPDCVPVHAVDCEGYEILEFAYDAAGRLVAIHVTAAG